MSTDFAHAALVPPFSILVMNGPNLGELGLRKPEIYGRRGMDAVPGLVADLMGPRATEVELSFFQANGEGALIDRLEAARREGAHGVALNAGAYTHTSLALADCLEWIGLPVVEVHISNTFARQEAIRRQSFMAAKALGIISGFGLMSYALAVQALHAHLRQGRPDTA